jgi:hypothetical protein
MVPDGRKDAMSTSRRRFQALSLSRGLLVALPALLGGAFGAQAASCEGSLAFGANAGTAAIAGLTVSGISASSPIRLRTSLGYAACDPGRAREARRVFINDATGGTPEKDGRIWTFGLDLLFPLARRSGHLLDLYAGPRYALFDGHFRYVGDNEEFDITSRHWVVGAGLESTTRLGERFSLGLGAGAEDFFPASLHGHDATYDPDDENVNSREDYKYADADRAVDQPTIELRLTAGLGCRFGR